MGILSRITGNQKQSPEDYSKGINDLNFLADSKHPQQQNITAMSDKQFNQLLEHMPQMPQQRKDSMIGKLLSGSANVAGKLVSVHGKKLSLEGKIINQRLYTGRGMSELVNPLGMAKPADPIDIYSVPRPSLANFNRDATQMDYVRGMATHCGCGNVVPMVQEIEENPKQTNKMMNFKKGMKMHFHGDAVTAGNISGSLGKLRVF